MLSVLFFFLPADSVAGLWGMMVMQILISIFTGIISPLVWSMYADVSDYAELKFNTASTGLIFSSASMAQKFGGAIGGASVMWLLAAIGYIQPQAGGDTTGCRGSIPLVSDDVRSLLRGSAQHHRRKLLSAYDRGD